MVEMVDFSCPGGGHQSEIPPNLPWPAGYWQPDLLAKGAVAVNPVLPSLPFDCMLEAEAAGLAVSGYEDSFGLRPTQSPLGVLQVPDFATPRPQAILAALAQLVQAEATPCLRLSGPCSVACQLLGMEEFFLRWRKGKMTDFVADYGRALGAYLNAAVQLGVRVVSYSDPMAASSLWGPARAADLAKEVTLPLLRQLQGCCVLHLCGKTSYALCRKGCATLNKLSLPHPMAYNQAVAALAYDQAVRTPLVLGNGCLNAAVQTDHLWQICLKATGSDC